MQQAAHDGCLQQSWNRVSDFYNEQRSLSASIEYGPLCPSEEELMLLSSLLGDMSQLSVLDAGCGGGQNAVRFALNGAKVTALDFSVRLLDYARDLADNAGADVQFILGTVESLDSVETDSQDLVFCINVLQYVLNVEQTLASFHRVLRHGGALVISTDHPMRSCFLDEQSNELTNYAERSYFATGPRRWSFDGKGTPMVSYDRSVERWVTLLHEADLSLVQLREPPVPPEMLDDLFPLDGPLAPLRNIPHTLVLAATAPAAESEQIP